MSLKKRTLRIVLIALFLVFFAGYFAFSTFFFSPLEGSLEQDVAALVPRNVDFFMARAKLGDVFDEFPQLSAQDEIETSPAWRASPLASACSARCAWASGWC